MQEDHRHLMVDEKFRIELDKFCEQVQKYSGAVSKLRNTILPEITKEEAKRVFNVETDRRLNLNVKYIEKGHPMTHGSNIIDCLISQTHPKDQALRNKSEISSVECIVDIRKRDGTSFHSNDMTKFNEFWQSCIRRMKEHKTYKFIIEENDKLLEEARKLKKEIATRIEEPWRI